MNRSEYFQLHYFFTFVLFVLMFYLIFSYYWKNLWRHYCTWKLPGPLALPFIGSAYVLRRGRKEIYSTAMDLCQKYSPILKLWIGSDLYVLTSRPKDLQIILPRILEKGEFYNLAEDYFKSSMLIAPLDIWKSRRKMINQTFNINILNSYVPIMVKYANKLKASLKEDCGYKKEPSDMFPKIWKITFLAACETLCDVDSDLIKEKDKFLNGIFRFEEILTERFYNPFLQNNHFWKFSKLRKEVLSISQQARKLVKQIISLRRCSSKQEAESIKDDPIKNKRFLNHLLELKDTNILTDEAILEETPLMLFAASETTAVVISSVLLVLGLYPDVQEKVFYELTSIIGDHDECISLDDVNRMNYLERVIKETMRLLSPVPMILRQLDRDVALDSYVLPAGAKVAVIISHIHRMPEFWPDPLKFDPDRFLPEQSENRHRQAYIPFSYGARNCIGSKYAMLSMKILLATVLKNYKVLDTVDYRGIEEIDHYFYLVAKAKKGYRVIIEKRVSDGLS